MGDIMKKCLALVMAGLTAQPSLTSAQALMDSEWSGFYGGIYAAHDFGTGGLTASNGATSGDFDVDGFSGGAVLGYNLQSGRTVYGVELDFGFGSIIGDATALCLADCFITISSVGTLRGRVGVTNGRFLTYVTGGLAVSQIEGYVNGTVGNDFTFGHTVGLGTEFALSNSTSLKADLLYMSYGDVDIPTLTHIVGDSSGYSLRLGANFHF